MATAGQVVPTTPSTARLPGALPLAGWHLVMGLACLAGAARVLQIEQIFNLGNFVQVFLAALLALVAAACFASGVLMLRMNSTGRLIGMAVNCAALVLALLYFGHLIGLYTGIDQFAEAIYHHVNWLLGMAAGYTVMWIGWRFSENSAARFYIERIGIFITLICLAAILLIPVWNPDNPLSGLLMNGLAELVRGVFRIDTLPVLIVAGIAGAALLYLLRHGAEFGETIAERDTWQGWFFLLPNLICFLLFFAGPLVLSFYLSFTDYNPVQADPARFTGLENYSNLLSLHITTLANDDASVSQALPTGYGEITRFYVGETLILVGGREPLFWSSLSNTIFYCLFLLLFSIPPALGLAMLLNSKIPGMKIFRAIFFIPSIAAVVGVALIWKWLYNDTVGYINHFIRTFIDPTAHIQWLADDRVMMLSVVIMAAWQVIGFNTVIFLAGLQGVQKELLEAASIDGAGRIARFRKIILPLLAPTTFFVTITTLIAGLQAFAEPYSLIGNNNPSNAKLTGVYYLYNEGFRNFKMGSASATAWALFILIFAITLIQFRLSSSNQAYSD